MGFIAAGPWDLIGHAEVPETKIDGKIARHLDRDDMVSNTINTFVSLTVQCAQCHNHKFDPISQEDYYRLQAVFAALDRADRPYFTDPAVRPKVGRITERLRDSLKQRREVVEARIAQAGGTPLADLDRKIAAAGSARTGRSATEGSQSRGGARQGASRPALVYAGTIHNGGGAAFRGTGPDGGKPRPIHLLRRGDVKSPGQEVGPGP